LLLDPKTTVTRLITAIPSSALVFTRFGIAVEGNETKPLQEVCSNFGIHLEEFLAAMDDIDWNEELPSDKAPN
jgi:hypothetical protein